MEKLQQVAQTWLVIGFNPAHWTCRKLPIQERKNIFALVTGQSHSFHSLTKYLKNCFINFN